MLSSEIRSSAACTEEDYIITEETMTFEEAVKTLWNEKTRVSKPGISRIRELLARCEHPEAQFPLVHIVGTNGKGSVTSMLSSVLNAAGYKTGAMMSPFRESVYDYYRIRGELAEKQDFCRAVAGVQGAAEQMEDAPTEFELSVAVGLCLFADAGCDIVLLEAGMGGANDASHVTEHSLLTVVTHMGLDHTGWLGNSLREILEEKLGIAGSGDAVLLSPNAPETVEIAAQIAFRRGLMLMTCKEEAQPDKDGTVSYGDWKRLHLSLEGSYQRRNVAAVLETLAILERRGFPVSEDAVRTGLGQTELPFRFQICRRQPYLILDGGHNPDCIAALCKSLRELPEHGPFSVVTGVMRDKDYERMYPQLDGFAGEYLAVTADNPRAFPAAELAAYLQRFGKPTAAAADFSEAAEWIRLRLEQSKPVLVTGTLYMMHDLTSALKERHIL